MRSRWISKAHLNEEASKFHNEVRDTLLNNPIWSPMKCYQEVPVVDLVPGYPHSSHHVDWYIDTYKVVIELHGAQHYKAVNYGGVGYDQAQRDFRAIQYRDNLKKTALLEAGYRYVEIPYKYQGKLDGELLKQLIIELGEEL